MAFDAYFLHFVLNEIRTEALGGRVEKIHQPARDTVIVQLRGPGGRKKLLIAANPTAPRLHLTTSNPENPDVPPAFCMFLRKHLQGARLVEVTQPPMERAATFVFDTLDDFGDPVQKKLICELMGRTSNIYLVGPEGRILDCLRRVGLDESVTRQALPGMFYQPPTPLNKIGPMGIAAEEVEGLLRCPGADRIADRIMDTFGGLSPLVCRELALNVAGDTDARLEGRDLTALSGKIAAWFSDYLGEKAAPYLVKLQGNPKAYAFCPVEQYGVEPEKLDAFGTLLDGFYTLRDRRDAMRQKSQAIRKTVTNLRDRTLRKMGLQEKELETAMDRERLRQLGDILTANIHNMERGQKQVRCQDFYDENMAEITIDLDVKLSPQQNAAKYYKDYTKAKNAEKVLTQQLELGEKEVQYLAAVLDELDRAGTENELEEIRSELIAGGYLKADGKKRVRQSASKPLAFSEQGYEILVGRNNHQNDQLTTKTARRDDLWFHVQKRHGSHVILRCAGATPPDEVITRAAELAAYHSEARQGQNVAVDVTQVKNVKKPAGSKPGMVVYYTYRTVYVNPAP